MNPYSLKARFYPAIITLLPLLVFNLFELPTVFTKIGSILWVNVLTNVSVLAILYYLFMQIIRFIAKEIFEKKYFQNGEKFPTTELLLFSNSTLSSQFKTTIRAKVKQLFDFDLPSEMEENNEINSARKILSEGVALIRNKTKAGNLVLQHNIEYGFVRNLIGGSIIGLILSSAVLYYYRNQTESYQFITFIFFAAFFLLILLLSKTLLNRFGEYYAKTLLNEFLAND